MMTRDEAMTQLSLFACANQYPELDSGTLNTFLETYKRFTPWQANYAYSVGDRVIPVVPNGRWYKCVINGTSGATEPDWPRYVAYQWKGYYTCEAVSTPNLTWVDQGPAPVELYDVRMAARAAWIYKAGLLANQVDSKESSTDIKLSELQQQCLKMAERYRPFTVVV